MPLEVPRLTLEPVSPWMVQAGAGTLCSQRDPLTRATPEASGPRTPHHPPLTRSCPPARSRPAVTPWHATRARLPLGALGDSLPGKVSLRGKFSSDERGAGLHSPSPARPQTREGSLWKGRQLAASTLF